MLTYTQDFSPYQLSASKVLSIADTNIEGKAAVRRRRQMERQQRRHREPDRLLLGAQALTQAAEQMALAVELAQDERMSCVIERALQPSRGATQAQLAEWFNLWRKPIRDWLCKGRGIPPGDIDDLAQEVFVRVLRYSQETVIENPAGYLFKIASNVAQEWKERWRFKKPHDPEWLDDIADDREPLEAIYLRGINEKILHDAVNLLPPRQRQVLLAHIVDEKTYKQVAVEFGLTYRIVLRDLTRAYATLRRQLR